MIIMIVVIQLLVAIIITRGLIILPLRILDYFGNRIVDLPAIGILLVLIWCVGAKRS